MKSYRTVLGLFALATAFVAAPAHANVEGMWRDKDGSTVRIQSCGENMCGSIASASRRIDPETGQPPTDKNNTDPSKRNRPLEGVPVLIGMHPVAPGKWTGKLYNVQDGKTYTGNLVEVNPDTIRIEGCVLFLCGGENLTRVKSTASSSR